MDNTVVEEKEGFTQEVAEVAALAEGQSALVPYVPKSKAPFKLATLTPRNMAFEVQKALNGVVRLRGNIDEYVRDHLKYGSVKDLWNGLAAEQVDGVALYLHQFGKGQGVVIADQTGIGKGRQAAAVIRHAITNGYLPVFFTRSPSLFSDMYRDLKNIGFENINPFIVNNEDKAKVRDAEGTVVFSPLSSERQKELLVMFKTVPTMSEESIQWHKRMERKLPDPEKVPTVDIPEPIDHLPLEYDCIFTTYSQVQSAHPFKREFLKRIAQSGVEGSKRNRKLVFILDESHMAGGFNSIIGRWMRRVLPSVQACAYLSATFAKYPEVMPLYSKKTAVQEAMMSDSRFVGAMESGGLALQEIVAANLTESGQLIRRQRSKEGIKVEYITLDQEPARSLHRERVNRIIKLMNEVVEFEEEYVAPILSDIHQAARRAGEGMGSAPKQLGVKQSPYFSRVFNIVDQLLFSLKVEEVAQQAIKLLNEDKKVVIAFKSTMGTFLKDMNLGSGDSVPPGQLDFVRSMVRGLDSVFKYNYTHIDGEKERMSIPLEELPPSGRDRYNEIKQAMLEESSGLSISPIDQLLQILESTAKPDRLGGHKEPNFKVAEVTGRNQRIVFEGGDAIVQPFRTNTERSFREFNNGGYDVLLINQAGSTGFSVHASEAFKDQRQRAMIVHQFDVDINIVVQLMGRIDRTGQVVLPEYYYMCTDIPAELRLMMMLKAKLKKLDANTTGSQKTSEDTLESQDFMNKYGDMVAWKWVEDNPALKEKMGWPTYRKVSTRNGPMWVRNETRTGAIRQVTGRAGLLLVEEQDELYKELLQRYEAQVKWEKQRGTYDLETEFLKLDADIKKKFLFIRGSGGSSPFGRDTVREETVVNNLKRPFTRDELDKVITAALDGKLPKQVQLETVAQVEQGYPAVVERKRKSRRATIDKLKEELEAMPSRGSGEDEKENAKIDRQREKVEELVRKKEQLLTGDMNEMEAIKGHIVKFTKYYKIGDVVKVPQPGSALTAYGVFVGMDIKTGEKKNPFTLSNVLMKFAVADSRKLVEYNLTMEQRGEISNIYTSSSDLTPEEIARVNTDWNGLIQESSKKREKRQILTENIVAASDNIGVLHKLVKYNTKEGTIKNGIMMHKSYGSGEDPLEAELPISEAHELIEALKVDNEFEDANGKIKFKRIGDNLFQLFIPKKGNYDLATDHVLRSLLVRPEDGSEDELPEFVQNAGDMTAVLHKKNLLPFLERLDAFGVKYMGKARELEDWEVENEEDWENKNRTKKGSFRYKLARRYGQGSNPTAGFVAFEEPSDRYRFGVVTFSRSLTDKEKYNYSLIPLFKNVHEPFKVWKDYIDGTAIEREYRSLAGSLERQPYLESLYRLGLFIFNTPPEDGNPEFVWGEFSEEELGQVAYDELLGEVGVLDTLIAKLNIALGNY